MVEPRPTVLERWFAAVALASESERAAAVDLGSQNVVAIATAHTACELCLGLIAGEGTTTPASNERFDALMQKAIEVLKSRGLEGLLPRSLRADLRDLNDVRNLALHRGLPVAYSAATRGPVTARAMLRVLPAVLAETPELVDGAGIASAVAALQDHEYLANSLRQADREFAQRDHIKAADWLAHALLVAERRAALPEMTRLHWMRVQIDRNLKEFIGDTESWIYEVATGIDKRTKERLGEILGTVLGVRHEDGRPMTRRSKEIGRDDVAWALGVVSTVAYRLWATGRLRLTKWEQKREASDQPASDQPA